LPVEPVEEAGPAVSVPAEPVDEVESAAPLPVEPVDEAEPTISVPAEPVAEVALPTSGTTNSRCTTGEIRDNAARNRFERTVSCVLDAEFRGGPVPDVGSGAVFILYGVGVGSEGDPAATPCVRIDENGGISAGNTSRTSAGEDLRDVGVFAGANDYEGTTVHSSGWFLAAGG